MFGERSWPGISSVFQLHRDMRKAQYSQRGCALRTESLVVRWRVMLYKPGICRTIPSHIIIWQGRQQHITHSHVQRVSSTEWIARCEDRHGTVGVTYTCLSQIGQVWALSRPTLHVTHHRALFGLFFFSQSIAAFCPCFWLLLFLHSFSILPILQSLLFPHPQGRW